ncbi:hypothetical protein ABFS83_08G170200 [Erythranthe nasuta]
MSLSRIATRFTRSVLTRRRNPALISGLRESKRLHTLSNYLVSLRRPNDMAVSGQMSLLHHSALSSSSFQWFGFTSSASPQSNDKEAAQSGENKDAAHQTEAPVADGKTESDSDGECDLSRDELMKLVVEKEQLLETKQEELEKMKDKVLRTYAEMENVKERTRRESENAKKFAIQNFAKGLLDVADNLSRASSAAKDSFSKIDESKGAAGSVQQLKTLLDGVEMTEKQLSAVFKNFGLEKYVPTDEEFDPNRHNAVFQVPDASKPPGHVGVVLKAGYMLHDRVVRPAEVGVTVAVDNEES